MYHTGLHLVKILQKKKKDVITVEDSVKCILKVRAIKALYA